MCILVQRPHTPSFSGIVTAHPRGLKSQHKGKSLGLVLIQTPARCTPCADTPSGVRGEDDLKSLGGYEG